MIALFRRWLSRLFTSRGRESRSPTTLIDRRVWILGYVPDDKERIQRARELELELSRLRGLLPPVSSGASMAFQHASQCRTIVADFLNERDGSFARAIRRWPAEHSGEIDAVLSEGEILLVRSKEALEMVDLLEVAQRKVCGLEAQYAESVPQLWQTFAGNAGLADQLNRCHSLVRLREVDQLIEEAQDALSSHYSRLQAIEGELLRICGEVAVSDDGVHKTNTEEQVRRLVERVNDISRETRLSAIRSIDESCKRHLVHLGHPNPQRAVKGKLLNSVQRGLIRWQQLNRTTVKE
jgi:hypothetical protein